MSWLDIYNSFQLEDVRADSANDRRIMELGQKAEFIQRKNGSSPESWYEFKIKHQEQDKPSIPGRTLAGILIGAAVMMFAAPAVIGLFTAGQFVASAGLLAKLGVAGALAGGMLGWDSAIKSENRANTKLTDKYSSYLDGYMQAQNLAKQQEQSSSIDYRNNHAERLAQSREEMTPRVR